MKAILVSVDYSDLLSITLPWNRHHFSDVVIVTTPTDVSAIKLGEENDCRVFQTESFYDDGAVFNKWKALEQGLDFLGRDGLICLMDADILWPKEVNKVQFDRSDCLYTPRRRVVYDVTKYNPSVSWNAFPIKNEPEFAGYSQIFFAEDKHLGKTPWHEINWKHAGGADSFFQRKWPERNKIRPDFEVLHLGDPGKNWCGRATKYIDGSLPKESSNRLSLLKEFIGSRTNGPNRFEKEKI